MKYQRRKIGVFLHDGHLFLQQQAQYFGSVNTAPKYAFEVDENTPRHIVNRIKVCWETVSKTYLDCEGYFVGINNVIFIVEFVTQTRIQCFN